MSEPPSPGVAGVTVVVADEQSDVTVDADRWARLATEVLHDQGHAGELTLTFVDRDEMSVLNEQHMGKRGPTDVLSFPLDSIDHGSADLPGPVLLGDVVVCPSVAAEAAPTHAGTLDDQLALLVVHGILHVLGHDHAEPGETRAMRDCELELLEAHHWHGPAPVAFRQVQQ